MSSLTVAILAATTVSAVLAAQDPRFEVASVKPHTSDDRREFMVAQANGRFTAGNITARLLIRSAYQLQDDQIVGGPDWLETARFDVDARAPRAGLPGPELLAMLKALLAERFNLKAHTETREISVFALERTKDDGSLGPGLRPTKCPDLTIDLGQPQPCTNAKTGVGSLALRGMPFDQFVPFLSSNVGRVVLDHTGLDGRYDIELTWTPEQRVQNPAAAGAPRAVDPDAVSIFTALQEQTGLRLSSAEMRAGHVDEAVREFEDALRKEPQSSNARANLGQIPYEQGAALLESRRYGDAAAILRTAVDLLPDSAEAHNDLGVALTSMGRVGEAVEYFRRAVTLQPDFAEARENLESAEHASGP